MEIRIILEHNGKRAEFERTIEAVELRGDDKLVVGSQWDKSPDHELVSAYIEARKVLNGWTGEKDTGA